MNIPPLPPQEGKPARMGARITDRTTEGEVVVHDSEEELPETKRLYGFLPTNPRCAARIGLLGAIRTSPIPYHSLGVEVWVEVPCEPSRDKMGQAASFCRRYVSYELGRAMDAVRERFDVQTESGE